MSDERDVYVSAVVGSDQHSGAVVATTPIRAGDLADEHVGRQLGFHDDRTQVNVPGEILRIQHNEGPPASVSIWFRFTATVPGALSRDDFMQVAPWQDLQLVEALLF